MLRSSFGHPVMAVDPRRAAVLRAAMPEAPVDDHGHPPAGKDDIRPHTYAGDVDAVILVEAIAAGVQQGADLSLGAVFTRPVAGLAVCDAYDLGGWCVGTRSSAASTPRPGLAASSGARGAGG